MYDLYSGFRGVRLDSEMIGRSAGLEPDHGTIVQVSSTKQSIDLCFLQRVSALIEI